MRGESYGTFARGDVYSRVTLQHAKQTHTQAQREGGREGRRGRQDRDADQRVNVVAGVGFSERKNDFAHARLALAMVKGVSDLELDCLGRMSGLAWAQVRVLCAARAHRLVAGPRPALRFDAWVCARKDLMRMR